MISEGRVIHMTKMAVRAKKLGADGMRINEYYRADYVGFGIVKTVVSVTVVYGMLIALYALFHFNTMLKDFYDNAGIEGYRMFLLWYLVLVALSVLVSYFVYTVRYNNTRKKIRHYYNDLKKLERTYRNRTSA